MNTNISFTGLSNSPSDYHAPDGALALSLDLTNEDGTLRAMPPPQELWRTDDRSLSICYIHEHANYRNLIAQSQDVGDSARLWFVQEADLSSDERRTELHRFRSIKQIKHMGNTLMVLDDEGMHYLLYASGAYKYLGTSIPEVHIQWGLQLIDYADMDNTDYRTETRTTRYTSDFQAYVIPKDEIVSKVLPKINKFIKEQATDKNRFIFPFFLRYALRLYDGSLTKHSAPILLIPNSAGISVGVVNIEYNIDHISPLCRLASIFYKIPQERDIEQWQDIVKSVDVFISSPIYTYKQNFTLKDKVSTIEGKDEDLFHLYWDNMTETENTRSRPQRPKTFSIGSIDQDFEMLGAHTYGKKLKEKYKASGHGDNALKIMYPPLLPEDEIYKAIRDVANFYLISSIPIEDLIRESNESYIPHTKPLLKPIKIKEGTLATLETGERMSDDFLSHDIIRPSLAFVYNARLNIAGLSTIPFAGYKPDSAVNYTTTSATTRTLIYIKQEGKEAIVESPSADINLESSYYYYYPNPNAYKVIFVTDAYIVEHQLTKHDFLYGAYVFKGFDAPLHRSGTRLSEAPHIEPRNNTFDLPNKIYTSEVNNPFFFPASGINTVGTGRIIGMSTATKALSEGQYGQFPLYAFTTEGVWALEVSDKGSYRAKHPTSRDVCINHHSITQTDNAVLFATARGLMLLSGSQVISISDDLRGKHFDLRLLPEYNELIKLSGYDASMLLGGSSLQDILPTCRTLYDYHAERIIIYAPSQIEDLSPKLAYVYSLRSRLWSMTTTSLQNSIPSYPEALAFSTDGCLLDYASEAYHGSEDRTKALLMTRPFKLGDGETYKTIRTLITRGMLHQESVRSILYGTEDYHSWSLIDSSDTAVLEGFSGTPYKAFRLILLLNLKPDEALSSCSIDFVPRFTHRLR